MTTWKAFYLKFNNYADEKHWSADQCKTKLMLCAGREGIGVLCDIA